MTFWKSNNVATQKPYSFFVEFQRYGNSYVAWEAKSVKLPSYGQEIFTDLAGNRHVSSEGASQWTSFTIDIYDLIGIEYEPPNSPFLTQTNRNKWKGLNNSSEKSTSFSILNWFSKKGMISLEDSTSDNSKTNTHWEINRLPNKITIYKIYTGRVKTKDIPLHLTNKWEINNPTLETVDFGQLDYSSEEPVVVSLTMISQDIKVTQEETTFKKKSD